MNPTCKRYSKGLLLLPLLLFALACAPSIGLGSTSGNQVPVNSEAAVLLPEEYRAVNVHVHMDISAGVNLASVALDSSGSILPSPLFCAGPAVPAGLPNDRVFGCTVLGDGSTAAGGLLSLLTFNSTGNGCIVVSLVQAPGNALLGTYTLGNTSATPQNNTVDVATRRQVLVGSGTPGDCPS